jgi:thiamine-monophosphate kinase
MLNLGLRGDNTIEDVNLIILGLEELEEEYSLKLLGGDTFRSPVLFLNITVAGESKNPINRSGAEIGDYIYITGNIGGSKMGLHAMKNNIESPVKKYHLRPEIRCREGLYLNNNYKITSMIDISDGFLIDVNHLAEESKKRFNIKSEKIPICPECMEFARKYSIDLIETVLTSGEEFELIFTSPENINEDFTSVIGDVSSGEGVFIDGKETESRGYRHFD